MRPRDPRHRCTFDQCRFDDPLLLVDGAVLPLGFGPRRPLDWDEFCDLRGSVHLPSKWTRILSVHFTRMTSDYTLVQTVAAVRLPAARDIGSTKRQKTEIPFGLYNGNLIIVKATVGTVKNVNLILDTGTSPSAISKEMADRLKVRGETETLQTLNGQMQAQSIILPHIQIGTLHADY